MSEKADNIHTLYQDEGVLREIRDRLKGGGGGGNSGDMDDRIARLEVHMEHVRKNVEDLRNGTDTIQATLARIESKLDTKVDWERLTGRLDDRESKLSARMLNKWDVAVVVGAIIGLALTLIAFGPRLVALLPQSS